MTRSKPIKTLPKSKSLGINLISDKEEVLCQLFDVIKEKNMYGKKVMGIERSTFIFHQGQLLKEYRKVKAARTCRASACGFNRFTGLIFKPLSKKAQ